LIFDQQLFLGGATLLKQISIALDGPAGSGKSTIAKRVAHRLGYIYIDTGAMYRAITFKAFQAGMDLQDPGALASLAEQTRIVLEYEPIPEGSKLHVLVDGQDVTEEIRTLNITNHVSIVAAVAGVRTALVKIQQEMGRKGGVVMDGRDIGTVVLPEAELKIYLTASVAERARRRWLELKEKGVVVELEELTRQIERRDYIDSNREADPLRKAEDAILLDTTDLTINDVVDRVSGMALEKGAVLVK
jgi:cytidylate kinase